MAVSRQRARAKAAESSETHHLVIDGRRWRKTDPSIPEKLRTELVHALMDARRAVLAAKRGADEAAEKVARAHVQDAKLALGERGEPYWQEEPSEAGQRKRAAATIRALLAHRAAGSGSATICPSDVARTIGGDTWRKQMQLVRDVAAALVKRGELRVLQRGHEVAIDQARGPIRLALPS